MRNVIQARGENIETFMDEVIALASRGYTRVNTSELAMSVQTNYWVISMISPEVAEVPVALEVVVVEEVTKATKPVKNKA
jgi:orotate phosphoribosyltransferase-like protein